MRRLLALPWLLQCTTASIFCLIHTATPSHSTRVGSLPYSYSICHNSTKELSSDDVFLHVVHEVTKWILLMVWMLWLPSCSGDIRTTLYRSGSNYTWNMGKEVRRFHFLHWLSDGFRHSAHLLEGTPLQRSLMGEDSANIQVGCSTTCNTYVT